MTETSTLPRGMRCVVVTGATSGIGRATAQMLIQRGSRVVVSGRRVDLLDSLVALAPDRVDALPCDLRQPDAVGTLLKEAAQRLGRLDGIVHSAGIIEHVRLPEVTPEMLQEHLDLHLLAPFRMYRGALELMADGGAVVVVSSTLATRPIVTSAAYSAAKAGALASLKVAALEGAPAGIRFNAVSPGLVDTPMVRASRPDAADGSLEQLADLHPLKRLGRPEEVAEAILYLLGAQWVTGTELVIDGGLMCRE